MAGSRFLLALLLLLPLGAPADQAPSSAENPNLAPLLAAIDAVPITDDGKPFLWKVTSRKKKQAGVVYLTGSIHLGQPDMYPLPAPVNAAFEESGILAVEMDLTDPATEAAMSAGISSISMLPEGQSLRGLLGDRFADLQTALASMSIPLAAVEPLSPFMLAMTLQVAEVMRAGWQPDLGIDEHFIRRAKEAGKSVVELEGLQRQLAVFTDMSLPVQVAMLKSSLDMRGATAAWTRKAWEALRVGDDSAMVALRELETPDTGSEYAEFERILLSDRNVEMADKLVQHIKRGEQTMFVVVGALHVPGDDGLVALLSKKKFLVVDRVAAP